MTVIKMESSCQLLAGTVEQPSGRPENYEGIPFTDEIVEPA